MWPSTGGRRPAPSTARDEPPDQHPPAARTAGTPPWPVPTWVVSLTAYTTAFLVLAAATWLVGRVLFSVPVLLYSLVSALLVAALLQPAVAALVRRGSPRWFAALLVELLLLVLLVTAGTLVVRRVTDQMDNVSGAVDRALANLQDRLGEPPFSFSEQRIAELRERLVEYLQGLVSPATGAAVALEVLSGLAIVVFVVFFLLKDGPRMASWLLEWVPTSRRPRAVAIGTSAWDTLTGYTRGVVVVALADAVSIGVVLSVLGVPLWLSLSVLVFLGAFVPFVGATVSGAIAVAVTAVTVGTWQALVVLAAVLVVQQVEGNLLQPLIMGRAVDLHPVAILVAITAGALLAGVGGAVIAVPVTAIGYRVVDQLVGPGSRRREPSRDAAAAPPQPSP